MISFFYDIRHLAFFRIWHILFARRSLLSICIYSCWILVPKLLIMRPIYCCKKIFPHIAWSFLMIRQKISKASQTRCSWWLVFSSLRILWSARTPCGIVIAHWLFVFFRGFLGVRFFFFFCDTSEYKTVTLKHLITTRKFGLIYWSKTI